ncbi:MAG TPA: FixH family protein [Saprospiraceae bacterium]|nr:FixH family protein [Saprospiraceae bacterium]
MKFNWGTGIVLAYSIFALGMVGAVFASRNHDPGLMQKDYYDLDLNYQARMVKKQNASVLTALPYARFDAFQKTISLQFPAGMNVTGGSAKFYRSATTRDDFSVKIENTNALEIPAAHLASGRWHIELDWEADGKPYFWETTINVIEGN